MVKEDRSGNDEKGLIFYHRAYRIFPSGGVRRHTIEILLLFLLFGLIVYLLFPLATRLTSYFSKQVLSYVMPPNTLQIIQKPFLFRHVYMIDRIGKFPGAFFLLITLIITLLIMIVVPRLKNIPKSFGTWISLAAAINMISCLFFLFFSNRFPYDIRIFSELYVETQVIIWFLIAFIVPMALAPFPVNIFLKIGVTGFILAYSVIFGCARYIIFLYILTKHSYLFMAPLFFIFGPLVDSVYIIGIYSLFISLVATKMKGVMTKWRWSY
ncbi:MAG: hypothetical protein WC081_06225 [Candidatus Ratteibacteria bacterium]|jgi:hypothetical protein